MTSLPSPPPPTGARRWPALRSIAALILREMESTYGRSPGGYLWAILEPVGAIAVMSVVFAMILRSPALGTNFPLFYATGWLSFSLFMSLSNLLANSLSYSRAFLGYPAVTFMDAMIARFVLNALTDLLVFAIVMTGIILWYDLYLVLDWGAIFTAIGMALTLAVGLGSVNCFLYARFPVWKSIWGIVSRPLFIVSCVIFLPEQIPQPWRDWAMLNPAAHIPTEMRRGFYATYEGVHAQPLYPFAVGIVLAIFGLLFLIRHHKNIAER